MAFIDIQNVKISGLAACVPERIENNYDSLLLPSDELKKYIETTGIVHRHCAVADGTICTSDLCYKASEKLLHELQWDKKEIDLLVFVSQTQDYKLPATSCLLQDRLGLSQQCMSFDVSYGCSGFIYGLSIVGALLSSGSLRKALLMVGNTQSVYASPYDKSMSLLLGDAGTVMALEYNIEESDEIKLGLYTDGSGKNALIVPDGGCRNPFTVHSLEMEDFEDGIKRSRLHEKMDGLDVFSFGLTRVPKAFNELIDYFHIDINAVDYLCLHQANKFLCEKIRRKMKFPAEKTPYNIQEFGNTSGATVPLLMVTELGSKLESHPLKILCAGFGVGLSWGTGYLTTNKIIVPELLTL